MGKGIETLYPRDWRDFGPRFGFAYQPGSQNKLVVRGGYGIYYQVPNVNYFGDNNPGNGGATGILANPGGSSPVYTLSNQSPLVIQNGVPVFGSSSFPSGPFGAFSVSQHFKTGYVQNTNLNIQYQVNRSSVLEVGYTGSLSRHLPVTLDINQIPAGSPEVPASRPYFRPFNLTTINEIQSVGNGYYNGMIVSLRTTNFHGLNLKLNYTYGHSRDDLSNTRDLRGVRAHEDARRITSLATRRIDANTLERLDAQAERQQMVDKVTSFARAHELPIPDRGEIQYPRVQDWWGDGQRW